MGIHSDAHICQCLSRLATLRRNSPVTISGHRRKTGEQFVEAILGLARGLLDLGLQPGDIVAICALNSDWFLEWLLAVTFVGGIAAPLNYRWSLDEARFAMEVVKPVMLVIDDCSSYWYSKLQRGTIPVLRWLVFMNSPSDCNNERFVLTTETLRKRVLRSLSFNYLWAPENAAIICFTSGTTGRPKGVTIRHSALIVQSLAKIAIVNYGEDDVYLHTAPLCHIGGISSAMAMLMVGGCHVLIPKFEANSALKAIEQLHVTSFITVPAIMADIVSLISQFSQLCLNFFFCNIMLNMPNLALSQFFAHISMQCFEGMTETCSSLTFMTLYDPTTDNSSHSFHVTCNIDSSLVHQPKGVCVGKAAPHVELRISSEDCSHVGRILTRGPHVMLGYWGQIPLEALSAGDDSWIDTGDVGWIDDFGNVWLVGRSKGRIKSGGENVYPEEVEAILSQHLGVSGIVVVGLPDARLTEVVVACLQIRDNWRWADSCSDHLAGKKDQTLSTQILRQFCRKMNLTGFKIPKSFVIWKKQFPLTSTGKLRRDEIRREVMSSSQILPSNL
ncbi:2-succinylbenzoate--CoA ligase, chloroplastic/peroxisomal-like [Camellia sinensis]|uniref:2-succinylbenzoate--CoA ligase, chloroplastic/peroxisomal-like n=1 Tax=Camellia sinensis TaxID=4442 RepID=UPI0010369E48|nr:2-succinylbenzoate--CoA ligase, chloroplastic/peroxisomal-like [Camellia sinensis]